MTGPGCEQSDDQDDWVSGLGLWAKVKRLTERTGYTPSRRQHRWHGENSQCDDSLQHDNCGFDPSDIRDAMVSRDASTYQPTDL